MFSVVFEVQPRQWEAYIGEAGMLRPELERIDGFVDNFRYRSLTRQGWLLSLSSWRNEKAVIRWRTTMRHHLAQQNGRADILLDYHLRVGEITHDTHLPADCVLQDQRLDETEIGDAKALTLVSGMADVGSGSDGSSILFEAARRLGLVPDADRLVSWDVFEAILTPGEQILLLSWRDKKAAYAHDSDGSPDLRTRQVRIIRDYSMTDRREAPQYYPEVERGT